MSERVAGAFSFAGAHRLALLAAGLVAVLAWPFPSLAPGVGGDWSWVAALFNAAKEGRDFGDDLVWTYGPLGFLMAPLLYYGDVALVAYAYQWSLQLLLAGTVFVAARRSLGAPLAVVAAFVVVALVPERALALGFAWCVLVLTHGDDAPGNGIARWFPAAIGALAGLLLLGKLNQGVELASLAIVTLAMRPGRRRSDAVAFASGLVLATVAGWTITGQTLEGAGDYVRYGVDIVSGYGAMGLADEKSLALRYWGVLAVVVLASVLVWDAARSAPRRARWGLVAVWALYAFGAFKAGFVRADAGHTGLFFGSMLMPLAVIPTRGRRRSLALIGVAICVPLCGAGYADRLGQLDPVSNVEAVFEQTRMLASSQRRASARADLAERIRTNFALPQAFVDDIGALPVAFWPFSFGDLPYAYPSLHWRPLPVIEPYAAYTPALDALGADMLASREAPDRIVRESRLVTIDDRLVTFEAPLTTRAILCRYRALAQDKRWQLLARVADRCGSTRELATVAARWGEAVQIPRSGRRDAIVLVEIDGATPHGVERLTAFLLRPDARHILLDGTPYRLVEATATQGLVLSVPPRADYPPPFAMAPNPQTIAVRQGGDEPGSKLRYTFLEQRIEAVEPRRNRSLATRR